jgi:hypothetical protein
MCRNLKPRGIICFRDFVTLEFVLVFDSNLQARMQTCRVLGKKRCKPCPTFCCYLINHKDLIVIVNTTSGLIILKIIEWSKITKNFSKVNKVLIDLHTGRLLAQSD